MSKDACEDYRKLSVYRLRKLGFLSPYWSGHIQWGSGERRDNVLLTVDLQSALPTMKLNYDYTSGYGADKVTIEEIIRLSKIQCHFGGVRWWMHCPILRSGLPCGRRTAILYLLNGHFGCRRCHYLAYESQAIKPSFRPYAKTINLMVLEDKYARSRYWKGQKTKRTRRIDAKWDSWEEPRWFMNS